MQHCRVPTQIVFSNSLCFPCPTANFPCDNLHNLWLLHTQNWLSRPIQLLEKKDFFLRQISQYPLLLESEYLQFEQAKFPVFGQNSLCFDKISKFPVFLPFSLCRGYPALLNQTLTDRPRARGSPCLVVSDRHVWGGSWVPRPRRLVILRYVRRRLRGWSGWGPGPRSVAWPDFPWPGTTSQWPARRSHLEWQIITIIIIIIFFFFLNDISQNMSKSEC